MAEQTVKEDELPECARMTEKEIQTFAMEFVNGDIVLASQVGVNLLPMVFMPLAFGDGRLPQKTNNVWASIKRDKTAQRSVNGWPIFMECHFLHEDDVPLVQTKVKQLQDALGVTSEKKENDNG